MTKAQKFMLSEMQEVGACSVIEMMTGFGPQWRRIFAALEAKHYLTIRPYARDGRIYQLGKMRRSRDDK